MNVSTYLERIGYAKRTRPDVDSLFGLHRTHLLNVPFENLDIHSGVPIQLNLTTLWDKIVIRKRGGFCYELNGLFAWLLTRIGFEVTYLNGQVYNSAGIRGRRFDHLALMVRVPGVEQGWLADIGFGDSFTEPLRLEFNDEQAERLRAFRIEPVSEGFDLVRRDYDGEWRRQYFFDLQPRNFPADYEEGCWYHQTSPLSSFTRERVISRATPDGRISLNSQHLKITRNGTFSKQEVNSEAEFYELLDTYFGIQRAAIQ
jgi:N-hydroxyarylamine O-acetyltransferase